MASQNQRLETDIHFNMAHNRQTRRLALKHRITLYHSRNLICCSLVFIIFLHISDPYIGQEESFIMGYK